MNIELDDSDLDSLPADHMLAFIECDKILRGKIVSVIWRINEKLGSKRVEEFSEFSSIPSIDPGLENPTEDMMLQHVALLEAMHRTLEISSTIEFELHRDQDDDFGYSYRNLLRQLDAFSLAYRLENRRSSADLGALRVVFENAEREEIHQHISKIRKVIAAADLSDRKSDILFDRLNALAKEVDRTMTRIDTYAAVALDITSAVGQAAEKLEPLVKIIERIGAVFGKAKSRQDTPELEAPEEKLQITDQTPDDIEGD